MTRTLTIVVLLLAGACQRQAGKKVITRLPAAVDPPEAQVAAVVDGRKITIADVEAQVRASGSSKEKALDDLILAEIMVREAEDRGLVSDEEVRRAAKHEMVRAFLGGEFEKEFTPENTVAGHELRKAYERNRVRLVHPDLKEVQHIVVLSKNEDPRARQIAESVHKRAREVKTIEEFEKLGTRCATEAEAIQLTCRPERGVTDEKTWTELPFAQASFQLKKPGEISGVVRTKVGYHVIRLVRDIPAENVSYAEAEPELRKQLFPEARRNAFAKYLEEHKSKHRVRVFPERLSGSLPEIPGR